MIKLLFIVVLGIFYVGFMQPQSGQTVATQPARSMVEAGSSADQIIADAFTRQQSNIQVQGHGTVTKILKDDTNGHQHQRFILRLANGRSLLVAHNTELAPRINDLKVGDTVEFYGEYEWNPKGGVLHWTHPDPRNQHPSGWLKHHGNTYQ